MSFLIDFADFIREYNTKIITGSYVDGSYVKTTTDGTMKAIIQPYSEASLNDNPIQRNRSLEGKDTKGIIHITTDTEFMINETQKVLVTYKNKTFEIEQDMFYDDIYPHYEYLASIVESDSI